MHSRMSAGGAVFADFLFAVSGGPCVLVQCVAVNIRLFAIFK